MIFQYTEFLGLAEDRVFRPLIPVTFIANRQSFNSYVLIDSGADYSILPIEIAGRLKLDISNQPRYQIISAGGNTFTIYKSPSKIEHVIQKRGFRDIIWEETVYFAESSSTLLLGQNGFLRHFKILLDGEKREVEIKKSIERSL